MRDVMLIRLRLDLETTNAVESVGPMPGQSVPTSQSQQQGHTEGGDHDDHQYYQSLHFYMSLHAVTLKTRQALLELDAEKVFFVYFNERPTNKLKSWQIW